MDIFLNWRGEVDDDQEKVSINRVDIDGNTAIHYAAANGLDSCVEKLIEAGAIISIVNKTQQTCCEMADDGNHRTLASMLELALVFQPVDEAMAVFDEENRYSHENRPAILCLDSKSMLMSELASFLDSTLRSFQTATVLSNGLNLSSTQSEALLESFCWDVSRLCNELRINPSQVFIGAKIAEQVVPHPSFEEFEPSFLSMTTTPKEKEDVDVNSIKVKEGDGLTLDDIFLDNISEEHNEEIGDKVKLLLKLLSNALPKL